MKHRQKKKTPTWFLVLVIIVMTVVFLMQMLFPTNLEKFLSEKTSAPAAISVTLTKEVNGYSVYKTTTSDKITSFYTWAETIEMRNRALTNNLNKNVKNAVQYNFAIETTNGTTTTFVIDTEGYIHYGAELYQYTGDKDQLINNLQKQLDSWNQN